MGVTPSDVLFAWDAGHGIVPTVGGDPSFSRGAEKYVRTRQRGGSPLYAPVQGDQVGYSWVEKDGVLLPRRALDLAPAVTPVNGDTVDFSGASDWTDDQQFVLSEVNSVFVGQTAWKHEGDGAAGFPGRDYFAGTLTSTPEVFSVIVEEVDADETEIRIWDDTSGNSVIRGVWDWGTESFSTVTQPVGSDAKARATKIAKRGPNGGVVWRLAIRADPDNPGNDRRLIIYANGTATNTKATVVHHAQAEERAFETNPVVVSGAAASRPADEFFITPGPYPPPLTQVWYVKFVAGTRLGMTTGFPRIVDHGDGSDPEMRVSEGNRGTPDGRVFFVFSDASGNRDLKNIDLGVVEPGQVVEIAYVGVPGDGRSRVVGRVDGGSALDSGGGGPGSWSTPDGLGADNRIVYNEDANLGNPYGGRQEYLRHIGVRGGALDTATLTGGAEALLDELADVPIGPHLAGHPQP